MFDYVSVWIRSSASVSQSVSQFCG